MAAPTDTPSKSVYFQRVVEDLKLDTRDPFTHIFAKTCALLDQRNDLLRELAAALKLIAEMDRVIDDAGVARSCINPLEDLKIAIDALKKERDEAVKKTAAARAEADELARRVAMRVWEIGACLNKPDAEAIIARVRAEMEKEKGNG